MRRTFIAFATGAALCALSDLGVGQSLDATGMPAALVAHAGLVQTRCSGCHTMSRVVKAKHRGSEWAEVVEDMRLREKSGISVMDAAKISAFLASWSTRDEKGAAAAPAKVETEGPAWISALGTRSPKRSTQARWSLAALASGMMEVPTLVGPVRVESVRWEQAGSGVLPHASVRLPGRTDSLEVAGTLLGTPSATAPVLHTWSVGVHRFQLEICLPLPTVSLPAPDLAALSLTLVVVRSSDSGALGPF